MSDAEKPLLHLVFGGHVDDPRTLDFSDPANLDIVGIYPNNAEALDAWRSASQSKVDDAHLKYVLVHLPRMLEDPEHDK